MDDSNCSSFNIERMDDTQDSIDPTLISENCSTFYERGDQGYICKVCEHHYASRRYVLFHLTNSHSIPTHSWPTCNKCGKIFTKPSKLAVHITNHPKKKYERDSDTPETTFIASTSPVVSTPVVKTTKHSTPERSKSKLKILKPKLLTVYFLRSSIPHSYKQNPYKCGKCFKSFLTTHSRELHRELIHKIITGSVCNHLVSSAKKTKARRKKSNRKLTNLNPSFPSKLKNYKHKHSSVSSSKPTYKISQYKKPSLSLGSSTPQEERARHTGHHSKLDFSSHIESIYPSKSTVVKRKSSSPQLAESVSKSSKRSISSSSRGQELELNGTHKMRERHSLPTPVPFGLDILMDDLSSDL